MSDNSSEQEPSIEEILASIRQIISDEDDETPVADEADVVEDVVEVAQAEPVPDPTSEPAAPVSEPIEDPIEDDDVFELSEDDLIEDEPEEDLYEEDDFEEEAYEEEPMEIEMRDTQDALEEIRQAKKKATAVVEAPAPVEQSYAEEEPRQQERDVPVSDILSSSAQAAALGSLSKLTNRMPVNSSRSFDGVTLEDIVKDMLNPMLREWMDDNLPPMVERIVQKELEKLARRAFDE